MTPTVSIVLITRNRPGEIADCLAHVLGQSQPPEEIMVVDSSTDDQTRRIVAGLTPSSGPVLRYIFSEAGMARQRARGVSECTGDIVFFLDDDVRLERDCLREIVRVFVAHDDGRVGGVTAHDVRSKRPPPWCLPEVVKRLCFLPCFARGRFRLSGLHTTANGLRGVREVEFMGGAFTAYRRAVLLECPPDGERFPGPFEDVDLSYRVSRRFRNYYTEFAHCEHRPSALNRRAPAERAAEMLHYYRVFYDKNLRRHRSVHLPHRIACRALAAGLNAMTTKDLLVWMSDAVLGTALTKQIRRGLRACRGATDRPAPSRGA
jgi:glycosyltransferase involved in cell wall biosynthesis